MPTKKYWPSGGTTLVPSMTSAAFAFVAEHSRLLDFDLDFSMGLIRELETKLNRLAQASRDSNASKALLLELMLTRTVDNFLCFLSELLALIYRERPEMLRSSETEKLEFVLQFADMDQLRSAIAEKRVERLSYLGLRELSEYIESQMSFKLFELAEDLGRAAYIVELRNICVHARGIVGNTSARRFPQMKTQIGRRIDLSADQVTRDRKFLEDCVFDIDLRATSKFTLPAERVPIPPLDL